MRIQNWMIWIMCVRICFGFSSASAGPSPQQVGQIRQFMKAADQGDMATAQSLMVEGIFINARDERGATALIHAAWEGRTQMVRFLVARGAAINVVALNKDTPLNAALRFGHHAIALLLMAKGADIHARDGEGYSTLFLAAQTGDVDIARKLIARGLDVNQCNDFHNPPLMRTIHNPLMLTFLLTKGANPNDAIHFECEDSVFIYAVRERALNAARLMLKYGANVNQEGRYAMRALDWAVENHDQPMIELLKRHKATRSR